MRIEVVSLINAAPISVFDLELDVDVHAASLGGLMDDSSQPLSFLESSVGFFDGGPITDKQFPPTG